MGCGIRDLRKYGFCTDNKVYVIAEIGLNHGGDIKLARKLIDSASATGADAVKFQTYISEKRAPKNSPIFDVLKKCELPFGAFKELKDHAGRRKIDFFSTPFDEESVDYLEGIGCKLYKIASFDTVNRNLLKKVASTRKPVILSTGMSSIKEISAAFNILRKKTCKIALLHCVSAYPTKEEDANLAAIYTLKENFDCVVGQSDHTDDITIPLYAVACGAQIIEKHYKINAEMDCVDAPVSITEMQMANLIINIRRMEKIMGNSLMGRNKAEAGSRIFRRYS